MDTAVYNTRTWRELPRDGECVVSFLFGPAAGACHGAMHRHHIDPDDPDSRSLQVCASHHPALQSSLRWLHRRRSGPRWLVTVNEDCPECHGDQWVSARTREDGSEEYRPCSLCLSSVAA